MLRLEWEPTAEDEQPLTDLTVMGSISNAPDSAEREGSWRGREDQNSPLLSLSSQTLLRTLVGYSMTC